MIGREPTMRHNITTLDRRIRAYLIAPVAAIVGAIVGPVTVGSVILYAVAAVMLATAAAGFCPLYAMVDPKQRHLRLH